MSTNYEVRERTDDRRGARGSTAAIPVLIGSLILIAGAFLDWASRSGEEATAAVTGTDAVDLSGFNVVDGRLAAGVGLALLIVAALMWANKRVGSWFDADLLCVALSGLTIGVIVMFLIDAGDTGLSAEIGPYVSLAGAAIAFIGALVALVRSGSDRATADREGRGDVGRRAA